MGDLVLKKYPDYFHMLSTLHWCIKSELTRQADWSDSKATCRVDASWRDGWRAGLFLWCTMRFFSLWAIVRTLPLFHWGSSNSGAVINDHLKSNESMLKQSKHFNMEQHKAAVRTGPLFPRCLTCSYSLAHFNSRLWGCLLSLESIMPPSSSPKQDKHVFRCYVHQRGNNNPRHRKLVLGLLDMVHLSYFSFVLLWLFVLRLNSIMSKHVARVSSTESFLWYCFAMGSINPFIA